MELSMEGVIDELMVKVKQQEVHFQKPSAVIFHPAKLIAAVFFLIIWHMIIQPLFYSKNGINASQTESFWFVILSARICDS